MVYGARVQEISFHLIEIRGGKRRYIKSGTMEDNLTTVQSKLEIGVNGTTAWRPKKV